MLGGFVSTRVEFWRLWRQVAFPPLIWSDSVSRLNISDPIGTWIHIQKNLLDRVIFTRSKLLNKIGQSHSC